jgi:hypothetical protein
VKSTQRVLKLRQGCGEALTARRLRLWLSAHAGPARHVRDNARHNGGKR